LSRAQVTRLICQWMRNHSIQKQPVRRTRFARRYTAQDVALLADVDAAHEDLSGPAIRHVLHREFTAYG
jgi:hypothetical protein